MRNAWSLGFALVARRAAGHAILLIGVGVIAPFVLQYALLGQAGTMMSPALVGQGALGGQSGLGIGPGAGATVLLVMALGFHLQTASYFASWRLGFGAGGSLGRALGYGLVAGLLALAVFVVVGIAAGLAARQVGLAGAPVLGALIFLIPLLFVFALFYAALAALVAAAVALLLLVAMGYGMASGQLGLAATMVGGSGGVVVLLLAMSAGLMWVTARLSCTAAVMADRRSFNLVAAIRESWRLTWEEQWAILRYLALIGFGLAVAILAIAVAAGAGAPALLRQSSPANLEIGAIVLRLAAAVPFAFLTVLVPAGIYRELRAAEVSAEVFA